MLDRRELLSLVASTGIGTAVFHRALASAAQDNGVSVENLKQAEWVSGIELTDEQRDEILRYVKINDRGNRRLREFEMTHETGPALHFQPISQRRSVPRTSRLSLLGGDTNLELPASERDIAFLPVSQLGAFLRSRKLKSETLTQIYLRRLKKFGPMLRCVVNLTEELALKQARQADRELDSGYIRGPLHGIPWGAKDLIDVEGYPTTWGIPHYRDRMSTTTATVAKRLEEAGAVLVAKLSLGALAMGDKWFGGLTRSPWNPPVGSSGSSAGSASATVAGLVGFSLGTETLGSILSPCIRCGATGLRPTFGRVSRYGCMPLSWSMDKVGPICRSVQDCIYVFNAIHGSDGKDATAGDYEFWPLDQNVSGMKIGYRKTDTSDDEREDLNILKSLGCELVEVSLPTDVPLRALTSIIDVEGASVFDQLLRDGHTDGWNTWPFTFRAAQHISGVDYVRFQRARTELMKLFEVAIKDVDAIVNMRDLVHTNFTGHPSVVFPASYKSSGEGQSIVPVEITGHLNDDDRILALGAAYQNKLTAHLIHPQLTPWLKKFENGELPDEAKSGADKKNAGKQAAGETKQDETKKDEAKPAQQDQSSSNGG